MMPRRLRRRLERMSWRRVFVLHPVRLESGGWAWLRTVERRGTPPCPAMQNWEGWTNAYREPREDTPSISAQVKEAYERDYGRGVLDVLLAEVLPY